MEVRCDDPTEVACESLAAEATVSAILAAPPPTAASPVDLGTEGEVDSPTGCWTGPPIETSGSWPVTFGCASGAEMWG